MNQPRPRQGLLLTALFAPVIVAVGLAAALAAGFVDVAATSRHWPITEWALHTVMERSVRAAAHDIEPPPGVDLRDPALAERAFGHYSAACASCHGAPGVAPAPWMVTNPPSPLLIDTADRWSDGELYWIVKHGIKMTGMPALGPTHEEGDLWAIAAFVRQLPEMTPSTYRAMEIRYLEAPRGAAHDHSKHTDAQ